jgi:hypothetical protein
MIDGGYYDNYGVFGLVAWLDQGLSALQRDCDKNTAYPADKTACESAALPRILVLQIRSFPADEEAQSSKKGWAFQLYTCEGTSLCALDSATASRSRGTKDVCPSVGTRFGGIERRQDPVCDVRIRRIQG